MTLQLVPAASILLAILVLETTAQSPCSNGQIRLNATSPTAQGVVANLRAMAAGRVEVCMGGTWGTVCDSNFNDLAAAVVCRQLGYSTRGASYVAAASLGKGEGPILLNDVSCRSNETRLVDCTYDHFTFYCDHSNDVGVVCFADNFTCVEGEVKLVGGVSNGTGTVQLCLNGQFGTICGYGFNTDEAQVVCGALGFQREGSVALSNAAYGSGIGPVLVVALNCNGTESNVSQCAYVDNFFSCGHYRDAGVVCKGGSATCVDHDIRLVGGRTRSEGRVEICYNGVWGTVCDGYYYYWTDLHADVVCRQLNYTTPGSVAVGSAAFGPGSGPIFVDAPFCTGNETSLASCTYQVGAGVDYCSHSQDAGVACLDPSNLCTNGSVRLVGGGTPNQGRVELCIGGDWGTICGDYNWDTAAARVVCNQLGYTNTTAPAIPNRNGYYGAGVGIIWRERFQCQGNEASLLKCVYNIPFFSYCEHTYDVGILCPAANVTSQSCPCQNGDVRLVDGTTRNEGRVEVCFNCVWGTVCDRLWSDKDAQVVCGQLGFSGRGVATGGQFFPAGTGLVFLDGVVCQGNESKLADCPRYVDIGLSYCGHTSDAGAICQTQNNSVCVDGAVRLMGTGDDNLGRVEICINNQWGTVCDNLWDNREAQVVCRQLGYNGSYAVAVSQGNFGPGSGRIYLNSLVCTGSESSLLDCPRGYWGIQYCSHLENDAGVICAAPPCKAGALRLADGTDQYSGRLEVCNGGQWGTVCGKDVSNDLARTACGLLGFDSKVAVSMGNAVFGKGTGNIYQLVQQCVGLNCTLVATSTNQCDHLDDLSVLCQPASVFHNCSTGAVRLVGGQTDGLVEVCLGGQWGTVCDDSWTDSSARVVCKQLGLPSDYAVTVPQSSAKFGSVQVPIALSRVKCTGNESSLLNCQLVSIAAASRHYCTHSNDVGVSCPATTPTSETPFTFESIGTIVDGSALPGAASTSASVAAIVAPIVVMIVLIVVIAVVMVAIVFYMCRGKLTRQFKLQGGTDTVPVMMDKGFTEMDNHPSDPTSAHEGAKAQTTSNVDGSYERMPE